MEILSKYWPIISGGVLVLISVLNALTNHPTFITNSKTKKILMYVVDILSFLKSADKRLLENHPRPKLPGTVSKLRGPSSKSGLIILLALGLGGCSTWQADSMKTLAGIHITVVQVSKTANKACIPVLKQCIVKGENPCAELLKCHAAREVLRKSLVTTERAVLTATQALLTYNNNKKNYSGFINTALEAYHALTQIINIWKEKGWDSSKLLGL